MKTKGEDVGVIKVFEFDKTITFGVNVCFGPGIYHHLLQFKQPFVIEWRVAPKVNQLYGKMHLNPKLFM